MARPLPSPNAETLPFWEGCRRGELLYQACGDCGRRQFYPRARCSICHSDRLDWARSGGLGTIHSFTIVHRAPSPAFRADVPYVIALVDLDEGFRMMMNVRRCPPEAVAIGMRVAVFFEKTEGDTPLPQAAPAGEPHAAV